MSLSLCFKILLQFDDQSTSQKLDNKMRLFEDAPDTPATQLKGESFDPSNDISDEDDTNDSYFDSSFKTEDAGGIDEHSETEIWPVPAKKVSFETLVLSCKTASLNQ